MEPDLTAAFTIDKFAPNSCEKAIPETQQGILFPRLTRHEVVIHIHTHGGVVGVTNIAFRSIGKDFETVGRHRCEVNRPV